MSWLPSATGADTVQAVLLAHGRFAIALSLGLRKGEALGLNMTEVGRAEPETSVPAVIWWTCATRSAARPESVTVAACVAVWASARRRGSIAASSPYRPDQKAPQA